MINWLHCFVPVARQNTVVGLRGGAKLFTSQARKQGERGRGSVTQYPQRPKDFSLGPALKGSTTSQSTALGTESLAHWLLENIPDLNSNNDFC